ncbi:glycosyltransferase family 1 protein [Pseudomonas sp. RIT-PI-AD]|uniref:glycosyltransferase family 4 protein n=1 Tax=Pseudomonas sp. RIT-PI-AD TaxID=3035294 RepID=UPI0021DA077D|nr:glycosyltransferase family 1 protein [Pseudomonas sp. RIT-PI-AD]
MPLSVGLNAAILRAPRTGIGHYLSELATALSRREDLDVSLFSGFRWQDRLPQAPMPGYSRWSSLVKKVVPQAYRLRRLVEQRRFDAGLRQRGIALYHEPSLWPLDFDGPMVMTLHDLTHVHFPETQPRDRLAEIQRHAERSVQRAQRILVDSRFVAREVRQLYGLAESKVIVAPLGYAPRFHPREAESLRAPLQRFGVKPGEYLLCVGTLEPRKNLPLALRAYARLPAAVRARFPLLIAGMPGWGLDSLADALPAALADGQVRLLGYQDDEGVAQLLAGARMLVFPSRYEGFGLPVLEAMASGTPVVLSSSSALPEVAGDAGRYFAVDDDAGCADAMRQLIDDEPGWQRCRAAGLGRAADFSWQRCATITAEAYRQAMES